MLCILSLVKKIKYILDYVIAVIAVIVLSPLFIILYFLVRILIGKPVFFKQIRPGYKGKVFTIYKFRTMTNQCDASGNLLEDKLRMTRLGKFMRSYSLDELPQIINILKGDLSLVGPRPLLVEYLTFYTSDEMKRHDVKPGITGWAQINGRNTISWKKKFELDLWYVNNWSLVLDIKILFLTVLKVIKKSDVQKNQNVTMPPYNGSN